MDTTGLTATLATATAKAGEIDSNYAATYYPWLRVIDTNTNKLIWVPPSVILPEIYAYNDNVAAEWFAPAGLNRGGIASAVGVKVRLPQASRDTLYEGKVNPIAQFPGQGICVWGQKTLQRRSSALDRVNVRRLLIAVKKYIASSARYLVFEQNVEATRNRFLNIVNPYLASVQERSGLYAFRVVMDETNNTPDVIDRNILYGQLYLQPTRTAEFIILDFNVLPTGATFPTA
jgi:phage tail sheath protein FI